MILLTRLTLAAAALALALGVNGAAWAQRKDCNDLKSEIEAKLKKNGVEKFTLDIVDKDAQVEEGAKVVGTCDGQTKKIVYRRGG